MPKPTHSQSAAAIGEAVARATAETVSMESGMGMSVKELKRQYNSALYTRLVLSLDKKKVQELSTKGLVVENQETL